MKEKDLREKYIKAIDLSDLRLDDVEIENISDECVQITLDYAREEAIGFSQWMHENTVKDAKFYTVILDVIWHNQTLEQCYEIYLTTKTK